MKWNEILRALSRVLTGMVFIFSGFVKAIDPLGSTYKFTDYFHAFGMDFMTPLAFPLAVLLSSVELMIGISLLLGYRMVFTSWILLLFMSFFTVLTFILALTNPVTDCGCFGDAIILTNWQTFWKNVILMFFVLVVFSGRRRFQPVRNPLTEWIVLVILFACTTMIPVYCYDHLPLIDFMPFSKGSSIPEGMAIPEDAPRDIYQTDLLYENRNTGKQEKFSIENIPDDSLWEFKSSESKLITKGYEPPIHDFNIITSEGREITGSVLEYPGYTFLLVSYNLGKADPEGLKKAGQFHKLAVALDDLEFYALTASLSEESGRISENFGLGYGFHNVDEIVLKTMVRANPGLILLKNGIVIGKWHYHDFPDPAEFGKDYLQMLNSYPLSRGVVLKDMVKTGTLDLSMISSEGTDISEQVLNAHNAFLVIAADPEKLNNEVTGRINQLTALPQTGGPLNFYGISSLSAEKLNSFTDKLLTPVIFYSSPSSFIRQTAGDGTCLCWLKDGTVAGSWKDENIPTPEKLQEIITGEQDRPLFEQAILPGLLSGMRTSSEKKTTYLFMLGFLVIALIIRIFVEDPFRK